MQYSVTLELHIAALETMVHRLDSRWKSKPRAVRRMNQRLVVYICIVCILVKSLKTVCVLWGCLILEKKPINTYTGAGCSSLFQKYTHTHRFEKNNSIPWSHLCGQQTSLQSCTELACQSVPHAGSSAVFQTQLSITCNFTLFNSHKCEHWTHNADSSSRWHMPVLFIMLILPYILAYKSLSRLSRPLKIESVCGPKSLTRV